MKDKLALIAHAQDYLNDLSQGIDPFTKCSVQSDSDLNNERLKRCFAFVSSVLGEVLENGGVNHGSDRVPFSLTENEIEAVPISQESVTAAKLAQQINRSIDTNRMKGVTATQITDAMEALGYLRSQIVDGKRIRTVTQSGFVAGIGQFDAVDPLGKPYNRIVYNREMQRYIIRNITAWTKGELTGNPAAQKECLDALGDALSGASVRGSDSNA